MNDNNSAGSFNIGAKSAATPNDTQNQNIASKDNKEATDKKVASSIVEEDDLDMPYLDKSSVTINLAKNYSLYRKANDKTLPKRQDFIGSSYNSSSVLSSNREEVEKFFPNIIGLATNHPDFVFRVKQYLNNIRVTVDELGRSFDTSFQYESKRAYLAIKKQIDKIEDDYNKVNKSNLSDLKKALTQKITLLNAVEGTKHKFGYPLNVEEYLMYRHCLLYKDIAKDVALINSDADIRFYFKDDKKEEEKAIKFRAEVNKAKRNYVEVISDPILFEAVYIQYCVSENFPVISSLAESAIIKEDKLDKFSAQNPVKFNRIVENADVKLIGTIEKLVARGELMRSSFNQNITTAEGIFIGSNIKEAIQWFKSPDNASTVNAYVNRLKNI